MPPPSNMRKSSTQIMAPGESHVNPLIAAAVANSAAQPRRTASGRAVRANTTRPTNYYARTFGNGISATDRDNYAAAGASSTDPAGFFPALQFFTDAITATPKEVIKHFTLLKEVESKILGPQEELGQHIDSLMQQPVSLRKQTIGAVNGATTGHGLLAFTANNSRSGSANVSMINGVTGHSARPSIAGSATGDETAETEADTIRRHQYHSLRALAHSLLGNMDEKNVVLSEANRVLALQHKRLDSVWPHLEQEISEEARLGSMTHWAYSDNRQKTKTTTNAQSRRDGVAATNALANVAAAIHDQEVAQARRDAGREARGEKNRGKRTEHAGDSDFDDKPRKAPKAGKGKAATNAATGLGISTNGEPATKRRKNAADKQMAPPAMERTTSTTGRGGKVRDTPRSTPVIDAPAKKAPKARPGPPKGKKIGGSTHNSPMLASSPLASSFNPATMEVPPGAKSQTARLRQNSSTTNLRLQNVALDEEAMISRPSSSAGKASEAGEKSNGRRKALETTEGHEDRTAEETTKSQLNAASEQLKREERAKHEVRGERRPPASRSGSDKDVSRKASGRQSKVGTPRTDSFPDGAGMVRSRSKRKGKPNGEEPESDSDEPQMRMPDGGRHKRQQSNSHLVKQLAPFNRSPDLDRHRSGDDNDSDSDKEVEEDRPGEEENEETAAERERRRASTRRPVSRRNTINMSPAVDSRDSSPPPSPPPTSIRGNGRSTAASVAAKREAEADAARREIVVAETIANVDVEEEDEESEHDPDDPDEPKYCYCNRGSYGEMVACDNDNCPREWFHLGCTELKEAPSEEEKWYCKECRPLFGQKVGRKGKAGRGRGG
ncbi:hypothetical protein DOTSEDRAFT_70966 [Dothistroma septosporum NZE10]|uniref:PHD-type domain-containing protein n=1 Tax=Dothistroma septosporum (strain NZE10 / CBS 128990) TaxID=675120 RepID=N1PNV0_DOTSN|nr:hypothetical protein DOTSEDRAFT_70966 [Dothistroma septosporum NZE10]